MQNRQNEVMVGAFMVLGFVALLFVALQVSGLQEFIGQRGYTIKAAFDSIGNLRVRSRVTVSGVQVGKVTAIELDPETFRSVVSMKLDDRYNTIPDDSTASIHTAGLIGENYIAILPGAAVMPHVLKEGSYIEDTQGALILENLIQKLFATKLTS